MEITNHQFSLKWDDPKLNISWPVSLPILSYRDQNAKLL
jgi:dTDP-4-dehydrorhamnose 3,5-epimerase-like enzyme